MREAVIVAAARTPVGRLAGALKDVPVESLGAVAIKEAVRRAGIDPNEIDDVIMGCALGTGRLNNISRMAMLVAGLPESVPAVTINRLCSSGLEAINYGCLKVAAGDAEIIVAGGVESMTRAPLIMDKLPNPYQRGPFTVWDSFGTPASSSPMSLYGPLIMGHTAENVAERYHVSRQDQDEFSYRSQMKAARAIREGKFKEEIIPVEAPGKKGQVTIVDTDEHPRPETTLEILAKLPPAFKKDGGTVTAGNSSGINDGAAAVIIMSRERARSMGLEPLATFVKSAAAGVDPLVMGIGPAYAVPKVLKKAGMDIKDIDLFEINEAFASQAVASIRELKLDEEKVNPNGGAVALGHPLGCSGARLTVTLFYEMKRTGKELGISTMCIGGGQGLATIFRRG
ncbi:MAG: thiolase family protein [Dehalococcoidia bacterium]|nr:thiolase family protein [Dehalococcoidia bacterium]